MAPGPALTTPAPTGAGVWGPRGQRWACAAIHPDLTSSVFMCFASAVAQGCSLVTGPGGCRHRLPAVQLPRVCHTVCT